jgi:hypothetical protein
VLSSYYFADGADATQKREYDNKVPARRLAEAMAGRKENSKAKPRDKEYKLNNRYDGAICKSHFGDC